MLFRSATTLRQALSSGSLPAQTLVWRKGLSQWQPASEHAELADAAQPAARLPTPAYAAEPSPAAAEPTVKASPEQAAPTQRPAPEIKPPAATDLEKRAGLQRRARDKRGESGRSKWSPATDTWTGPKVTRRVPDAHREQLLQLAAGAAPQQAPAMSRPPAQEAPQDEGPTIADLEAALVELEQRWRNWRLVALVAGGVALASMAVALWLGLR